jgi:hypothetical protein
MAKKRQRRSSEEVSKALSEVEKLMSGPKPLSLNEACKKAGIFPSTYYYNKGEEKSAVTTAPIQQETVRATETTGTRISKAELELLQLKAKLYDKGISLDQ